LPLEPSTLVEAGVDPYLTSRDRSMFLIMVQPEDARSRVDTIAPFLARVRDTLDQAGLDKLGIRAGLTGIPQYAVDDRDIIQKDINLLSWISFALIGALFFVAFGALRLPLMAMLTLVFAVVFTVGLVSVYPGHLTLLSAFFASVLFGLGIDYGIHLINRMEEFVRDGMTENDALIASSAALAPELTTGAITTAAAFFSIVFSGFKGFAELGVIAGVGVLVCLFMMVTLLPAMAALFPNRIGRIATGKIDRLGGILLVAQHPAWAILLGAGAVACALMGRPAFNGNYMDLQPADSETARLERKLVEKSNFSPQFAVFTFDDKAKAVDVADRLLDEPTVAEVRSISDLEMLAPVVGNAAGWPAWFLRGFRSEAGRYAVYAYPKANVWEPGQQEEFVAAMKSYDTGVTGMPVLGKFMMERSERALVITETLGGFVVFACILLNFRRLIPALLAAMPTIMTMMGMHGIMKLLSMSYTPLNIMALPVVLGIAVDNGVHIVQRYAAEKGDMKRTLAGSGRSVLLATLTTLAAFGSLALTRHRGMASFALLLTIGVAASFLLSVIVLPALLRLVPVRLLATRE